MTQKINDGGPAFPFVANDRSNMGMQTNGMTLRDYFAGQATGLDADDDAVYASEFNKDTQPKSGDRPGWMMWFAKADATIRYLKADAMIAAREAAQ